VLALSGVMSREATAQGTSKPGKPKVYQNYPNPFNPETTIPFDVGDYPNCTGSSQQHRVSVKIFNILLNVVAIPVLKGSSGGVSGGTPLDNVSLTCGHYEAFWNGKVLSNGREAASGVYPYAVTVDGQMTFKKAISTK
jgi:hypothetical protein